MRKLAFVFPGQGSQFVGMGKEIYEEFKVAREIYDISSEVLNLDIRKLINEGTLEELSKTENTQPIVLATSIAVLKVYEEVIGIKPYITAGHSLGEITALTAAGAINFPDAINIVKNRALFMKEAEKEDQCGMYAIRNLHYSTVKEICDKFNYEDKIAVISNYNSITQVVISGHIQALEILKKELEAAGAIATRLKVSGAFHSPIMKEAAMKFKDHLGNYSFNKLKYPVLSNIDGKVYNDESNIIANLSNQMIMPVQWIKTIQSFDELGIDTTIELGGGRILSNLIKNNSQNIKTYNVEKISDFEKLENEVKINYEKKKQSVVDKCIAISVCTKNRNFNSDEYEKGVLDEHKKLYKMQQLLEEENRDANEDEVENVITILTTILTCKKVPEVEKNERMNELMNTIESHEKNKVLMENF